MAKITTVKAYFQTLSPKEKKVLSELRSWILEIVPEAVECISYNMPTYKVRGKAVAGYLSHQKHFSYYPHSGSTLASFPREMATYGGTKSALHFTEDKPLTKTLVKKLIQARLKEIK
jgi:uncharacterized protein YdhG (YjbR/CyaY superfamily)